MGSPFTHSGTKTKSCDNCLDLFKRNPNQFLRRFVTVDETWIHHYTPETKIQSGQWILPGERAPKKAQTVQSAGKVMATVFWDSQGIIFIDYLEKGKTITGNTTVNYWVDSTLHSRKNGLFRTAKKCSFTTITHRLTHQHL